MIIKKSQPPSADSPFREEQPTKRGVEEGTSLAKAGALSRRSVLASGLLGVTAVNLVPSFAFATECLPASCTIWAGQTINVGTMTVSNDSTYLYIKIELSGGWVFDPGKTEQVKIWTGTDLTTIPDTGNGTPIPGQFPFKDTTSGSTYTAVIPLLDAGIIVPAGCGSKLYIVAHLDVTGPGGGQTAFGGCVGVNVKEPGRWWYYMEYTVCCTTNPPPDLGGCTTAFAKGQWVWVTDGKANPENLKTLGLIRNRWGWAINLTTTGRTVYDIWAGAGLNYTSKGTKVGTLTIDWNGATVIVRYQLLDGYRLAETHVYAAAKPPTTTAPGQYGNLRYFTAAQNVSTDQYILPLADDGYADKCGSGTCSGVWIIAHAVVCDETA